MLLAEAVAGLAGASIALALMPFSRAIRSSAGPLGRATGEAADDSIWALRAAARRVPWRAVCIHQGIAAQRMLRRRGIDARLHYGIGTGDTDVLKAHVWVTVGDDIVIGGESAGEFARVATWP